MKLRYEQDLVDAIDKDLAWRKKELTFLRSAIKQSTSKEAVLECLLRGGITLLYAHWEGFVRVAATRYLEFVAVRSLRFTELTPNFAAIALKRQLDSATQSSKAAVYVRATTFLLTELNNNRFKQHSGAVRTQSNLSSTVLRDLMHLLGLDYAPFQTKEKLIDEKLLHQRNTVAHGEYLSIDLANYEVLHSEIVGLLDNIRTQVENAAMMKAYRQPQPAAIQPPPQPI